jgi:hypothetical protein
MPPILTAETEVATALNGDLLKAPTPSRALTERLTRSPASASSCLRIILTDRCRKSRQTSSQVRTFSFRRCSESAYTSIYDSANPLRVAAYVHTCHHWRADPREPAVTGRADRWIRWTTTGCVAMVALIASTRQSLSSFHAGMVATISSSTEIRSTPRLLI